MRTWLFLAMAIGTITVAAASRQTAVAPSGTAVLTGTLVSGSPPRPVRRATVRLAGAAGTSTRLVGTDDEGKFVFDALPAGSFTLSAIKPGYVPAFYGAKHPGRGPGVPVAVGAGARVQVTLEILQGAAITGTITDAFGRPAPGIAVHAIELRASGATTARATTDDRGMYRMFSLAPGDYLVAAIPQLNTAGRGVSAGEVLGVTDAEVQWARSTGAARAMPPPGRPVAYAPVYYPGTPDVASAAPLTLSAGEERPGVSMTIRIVPVSAIAGTLVDAAGQPVSPATVTLYPRRRDRPTPADLLVTSGALVLPRATSGGGAFSIGGVAPGEYTIVARSGSGQRATAPPDPNAPGPLWSVTDLVVDGNDQSNLVLRLLPGLKLAGRIAFQGASLKPPPDLSVVDISLAGAGSNLGTASTPRAIVEATGAFRFIGIAPGTYMLKVNPPAGGWALKSAVLNGRDLADLPLDVKAGGEADALIVTFTDRAAEISGLLVDPTGRPVTRYVIVVFSVDRALWVPGSRRVQLTQPATDGSFTVGGLPAGEYAIAAAEDIEAADLADPALLSRLLAAAYKVSLAEGEKRRQDLKAGR